MSEGRRLTVDLGLFVAQSLIFWTAGVKLYLCLHVALSISTALTKLAVFLACSLATVLLGEVYYRTVDLPSQWLARKTYDWLLL